MIESANFQDNRRLHIVDTFLINLTTLTVIPIKLCKYSKKLRGKWIVIDSLLKCSKKRKIVSLSISKKDCNKKLKKCLIKNKSIKLVFLLKDVKLINMPNLWITVEEALYDPKLLRKIWTWLTDHVLQDQWVVGQTQTLGYSNK